MCGEYGENQDLTTTSTIGRPHYHAIIFNHDFSDKKLAQTINDVPLYHSDKLTKLWGKGHTSIGDVTFDSAAYVARYIMKKINGELAEDHYQRVDNTTGEITYLHPEYCTQSNKPGIARAWFEKFYKTDLQKDFITVKGKKMRPPKYYDRCFEQLDEDTYDYIKLARSQQIDPDDLEFSTDRLHIKHRIKQLKLKKLIRDKL